MFMPMSIKNFKNVYLLITAFFAYFFCAVLDICNADTLYLKSGKKIRCEITASSNKIVMIKDEGGSVQIYSMKDIDKIEKNDLKTEAGSSKVVNILKSPETVEEAAYILYRPSGIDTSKRYPLVITLSPGADAISMINQWKPLAEKYKWIVLASKEFKNGTESKPILSGLVTTVNMLPVDRFPIDMKKIVATGLSGGGMGSHEFAFLFPNFISAIIANTGMINEYYLSQQSSYPRGGIAVFLASPTDFRYQAMKQNMDFLDGLNWNIKWIEFTGGHTMAPESTYKEAIEWIIKQWAK